MRIFKFLLSLTLTLGLIYLLDNRWVVNNQPIPPLGKFLDPFHGFWQNIEPRQVKVKDVQVPGLSGTVQVVFDSLMVPHIFAENEDDLFFAQGYITAYHRLWQMEFQTHAAAGRLSEVIQSDAALDYDRRQRRLGMAYGAEQALEAMMKDANVSRAITQYTNGVNAYIESLSYRDLPFEYKLLDYQPEPWTPLKMGLLLKNLSQSLNIKENDFEMTNALKLFGKDVVDMLYAENDHPAGDPIVDNPGGWNFTPIKLDSVPPALPDQLVSLPATHDKTRGVGSNNWAVHGSRTASGQPILSNDPHLSLSLPSIWYVVHLNAPGINTMGASFPGTPLVILGFNDSIAWGCTNGQRDLTDWYSIKFKDASRNEYLSDGKWKKTTKRIEAFKVRGGETFYDTVIYTHHGPVVYDQNFHGDHEKNHYAFRWLAHDGSEELKTFYLLNKARNYDDFTKALTYWSGPAQNFAFASVQGDIAIHIQGKFPVRRKDEGRFVLDGTSTHTEWKAYIPQDQLIYSHNPSRGFVSSANQYPADATYPYYIQSHYYETFRNRRINEVLTKTTNVTPFDMMKLQNDNYNLQAAESLPLMLSLLDTVSLKGEERRIAEALGYWDFFNNRESMEASYYEAWWETMLDLTFDEFRKENVSLAMPNDFSVIRIMKSNPGFSFFDKLDTPEKETLKEIVNEAFQKSVAAIREWEAQKHQPAQWADYKDTYIQHLLQMEPLSHHPRIGGNSGIVNAAGKRVGPSWRYVVSMERPIRAWGIYPAGQSGNPGSPYYKNFIDDWAAGNYYQLIFDRQIESVKERGILTVSLKPKN